MQPTSANKYGVVPQGRREVVASLGRAYAAVKLALCEDGLYRCGVELDYLHGGVHAPIFADGDGYATVEAAREAALEDLLRCCREPFPSDPQSVKDAIEALREQIAARLRQPCLL